MERKGMDALALDALGSGWAPGKPKDGFDVIPMWVADMNFPTVPTVCEAIIKRAFHPAFGYFDPSEEYYESIIRWHRDRNGVSGLLPEHIGYDNSVLGGLMSAIGTFCSRGDNVILNSPTYMGFTGSLKNGGYNIVDSPLYLDSDGVWRMDFEDMEKKIEENNIHAAVFCSPHNPTGRVWKKWEIEKAMDIYRRHDVYVVSDEIWSDILLGGHRHTPTQSVSEDAKNRTVALYAPSKTFNLAGLVASYNIIYNKRLRDRVRKEASLSHYNSMNVLSMYALIGAYGEEGREWVDELCETLTGNIKYAYGFIREKVPLLRVSEPEGTYMLFIDCGIWLEEKNMTLDELLVRGWDVGVAWQDGRQHGGDRHIRLNLALPLSRVKEAFLRLQKYVFI